VGPRRAGFRRAGALRMLCGSCHDAIAMSQRLCSLDELQDMQPVTVEARVEGEPESLILLRSGDRVSVFLNVCPHAGRRLDWAPGKFLMEGGRLVCAAHGASFDMPSGACVAGPCKGQSLRALEPRVEAGEVWIDGA
jgi:nitrite reductase/ring-hydroxylating ferredoxin subunit